MQLLCPPDLSSAAGVVALDGTLTVRLWNLILNANFRHKHILGSCDKERYLKTTMGYQIEQANADPKPYSSGEYVTPDADEALLLGIEIEEGTKASLVTTKQAMEN